MKNINQRKIAVIGAGLVGTTFISTAQALGLASVYGIIDINEKRVIANVKDFEDASASVIEGHSVKAMTFSDLKDVNVIVITAGRPQKPGETRLDLIGDNAKTMANIAKNVKESGFNGIVVLNANPVDVMTYIFAKVSGFEKSRIISSGTLLESARLRVEIGQRLHVNPSTIHAVVMGEHGDSSVSIFETASVGGVPYPELAKQHKITKEEEDQMQDVVRHKAYKIIEGKGSTFYGIGANTARLVKAILDDEQSVFSVGAYLTGEYGQKDLYIGVPAIIGGNGVTKVLEMPISKEKHELFEKSAKIIKENIKLAMEKAGIK